MGVIGSSAKMRYCVLAEEPIQFLTINNCIFI